MMPSSPQHNSVDEDRSAQETPKIFPPFDEENAANRSKTLSLLNHGKRFWGPVLFAIFFPSLVTWIYFIAGSRDGNFSRNAFLTGKTIQFLFPFVWMALVLKERWFLRRFKKTGVIAGLGFGLAVFFLIQIVFNLIESQNFFPEILRQFQEELSGRLVNNGIQTPLAFLLLSVFYSVIHSGLEEYYWRWFVGGHLRRRFSRWGAAMISSSGFTLHHILLLACYFGPSHWVTWVCVAGVWIGGLFWAILYDRSDSIYGPWLSHGLVDAALFAVGYTVLFH